MIKTKIYILRHGETKWNAQKKFQGQQDSNLTKLGKIQALESAKNIKEHIDVAYSSSSGRAYETAKIILEELFLKSENITLQTEDDLREIKLGVWEGQKIEDVKKDYFNEYKIFIKNPEKFVLKNAETFKEAQDRAVKVILNILKLNKGKNILLVSHAGIIKLILAYFENRDISKIRETPSIKNCSCNIIETVNGKFEIILNK